MSAARKVGYLASVAGILAFFVTLPPILVRTPFPSLVLAGLGVFGGIWAIRNGERRPGWIGLVISLLGATGTVLATRAGVGNLEHAIVWSALIAAMLRFATPLIFAALGGIVSERAGVINIGLDGMMMTGAFFGFWGADLTGSWVGGVVVGMAAGALIGLLFAFFSITLRANQIVSGMAINLLALGVTGYLLIDIYGTQATPKGIPEVPDILLPLNGVPFFNGAFGELNLMVWLALGLTLVVFLFLFRTSIGLRLRSVGENPLASDTAGLSVIRTRYLAVISSGVLASLGGVFLSIGFNHSFTQNMTFGKGFIALAVVIFGKWRPGGALLAALLFGFSQAISQALPVFSPSASSLFGILPYVLTLVAVAGLVGRSRYPAALGLPYKRS
jgi:simple sugar transport system permease protein